MNGYPRKQNTLRIGLLGLFAFAVWLPAAAQESPPPTPASPAAEQADRSASKESETPETGQAVEPQPARAVNRSNPRATMATFLNAIDEAERGKVERYVDALACLDLSGLSDLPDDARVPQGRKLASRLGEFIGQRGLELELIPDTPEGEPYTYYESPDGRAIQIKRFEEGVWLFTGESLALAQEPPEETAPTNESLQAQERSPAEATPAPPAGGEPARGVPAKFRSARATMRTFREAMEDGRIDDAAECLDLLHIAVVARGEKGRELASYLDAVIKWTKVVVLPTVPDDPMGKPYVFRQDELGTIAIARQDEGGERPGQWLFTRNTIAGLEKLYDSLEQQAREREEALRRAGKQITAEDQGVVTTLPLSLWLRSQIPESLKGSWFLLQHWQWLGLVALLLLGRVAQWIITSLLRGLTGWWLRGRRVTVDDAVQRNSFRPVGILVLSGIWYWGLQWLSLPANVLAVLMYAVKFIACWAVVWTVYRAIDLLCDYFSSLAEKTTTKVDDLLVPFIRKVAKTLVTVLGIVFIVQQFTEETPLKLLAGLGLGGLALALAAQDTLKNLFGSLTVILDRPFRVGDWVLIGDIEGTIESVGFRSTRIRTFYNSQVVVPNLSLTSTTIDNYGARRFRRAKIMLSVPYSTPPEKIDAFCEGIRELVRLHPYTRKDYYHVYFNQFAASSLDILLYIFFETPDWSTELRERHRLFIDILRLARKLGVEFAFPTQTVWLERASKEARPVPGVAIAPGKDDPDAIGFDQAARVFKEAYGEKPATRPPVVIDTTPRTKLNPQGDKDGE